MNQGNSQDAIAKIEIYLVDLSQDKPYLGSLREGETVNESGYFVRQGNRTVYPRKNRSLVVKLTTTDGVIGWGETYGLVAPQATAAIISDLLAGFVIGRDPFEVEAIHDANSRLRFRPPRRHLVEALRTRKVVAGPWF